MNELPCPCCSNPLVPGTTHHRGVLINSIAFTSSNVISERETLQRLQGIRGNKQTREQLARMIDDSRRRLASLESRLADLERIRSECYGGQCHSVPSRATEG